MAVKDWLRSRSLIPFNLERSETLRSWSWSPTKPSCWWVLLSLWLLQLLLFSNCELTSKLRLFSKELLSNWECWIWTELEWFLNCRSLLLCLPPVNKKGAKHDRLRESIWGMDWLLESMYVVELGSNMVSSKHHKD